MEVDATIHQKVYINDFTINQITREKLIALYDVPLNRGVRPDSLYIADGNLMKYEDHGRNFEERTVIRPATELDKALSMVLRELK